MGNTESVVNQGRFESGNETPQKKPRMINTSQSTRTATPYTPTTRRTSPQTTFISSSISTSILRAKLQNNKLFAPVLWQKYIDSCVEEISLHRSDLDEKQKLYEALQADIRIFRPPHTKSEIGLNLYDVLPTQLKIASENNRYSFLNSQRDTRWHKDDTRKVFYTDYRGAFMYQYKDAVLNTLQLNEDDQNQDARTWLTKWYPMLNIDKAVEIVRPLLFVLCHNYQTKDGISKFQQRSLEKALITMIEKHQIIVDCTSTENQKHCVIFRAFLIALLTAIYNTMKLVDDEMENIVEFVKMVNDNKVAKNTMSAFVIDVVINPKSPINVEFHKTNLASTLKKAFQSFKMDALLMQLSDW